jgi:hypothetical protein
VDPIHPPAVVRQQADLNTFISQAQAEFQAGMACWTKGPEHFRRLGEALLKIKELVGHGNWLPTLRDHFPFSERQARRYIELANRPFSADLAEAWRIINGNKSGDDDDDDEEQVAEHDPEVSSPDRPAADNADPNEQDEDQEPEGPSEAPAPAAGDGGETGGPTGSTPESGPVIPERLKPYFEDAPLFDQAARRAVPLANLLAQIEQSPAFLKAVEGKKYTLHSTRVRAAGQVMAALKPVRPCPACGGAEEPSLENDRCEACEGKGYQTADDIEAAK